MKHLSQVTLLTGCRNNAYPSKEVDVPLQGQMVSSPRKNASLNVYKVPMEVKYDFLFVYICSATILSISRDWENNLYTNIILQEKLLKS